MKSTFTKVTSDFWKDCDCTRCRILYRDIRKKCVKSKISNRAVREYQKALMEEALAEHEETLYYEWLYGYWNDDFDNYGGYLLDRWERNCYEADPEVFFYNPEEVVRQTQGIFDKTFRTFDIARGIERGKRQYGIFEG